jgi:Glu-tRNA(Gln) amidotransferase subunit E-like FAD-binding protein
MAFNDPFDKKKDSFVSIGTIAEKLIWAADRIVDYEIAIALGYEMPEGFERGNKDYQAKILEKVKPMIESYQQTKEIDANSANQVVGLLAKGKITAGEAHSLLKVVREKIRLEEDEIAFAIKKQLLEQVDKEDVCRLTDEPKEQPESENSDDG